ncbi:uncharacterized protein RAG0_02787 [Rhynchosporium agropyri]|uniref:HD/PDEase domain-containing protein n=1 Tax=Rhynchosporium agropyri TaxID=914238 RepID=A0A1E1K2N0_9HELO|nr:uncharacterized protein RAG0_02787 [Rhynchosporium agropyri]
MRLLDEVIKTKSATSPLPFIRMLRYMSNIKRKGWIKRGMREPDVDKAQVESNASHSWGVAVICLLCSPKNEAVKCTILGLIHDLGEIVIGDVIPSEGIDKADKRRHEQLGQKFLVHVSRTNTMGLFFSEFEARESNAAQIAHEADSLECRIQAVIYISRYPQLKKLLEFLEPLPKTVYFQDLTNLLLEEEIWLREKQSPEKQSRLTIIFVIGGPGVGKDTQCNKLANEFKFCHIPTGELLRNEVTRSGSRYAKFIQDSMKIGFNVPAKLMISLLTAAAEGFQWILNGFPRSFEQLSTFEQLVSPQFSTLSLECPEEMPEDEFEEVLRIRLLKRAISSLRSDDEEKAIENRLQSYRNEKLLRINSIGSEEEVYTLVKEGFERLQRAM